jgi:micrococcal nuclease
MYKYNVIIKEIIDGDTVKVDIDLGFDMWLRNQLVRLSGIDAPESRTTNLTEKKYGLQTKAFIEKMMPVGSEQQLLSAKIQKEKYGRILGEFFITYADLNSTNLNKLLVDKHLAIVYDGNSSKGELRAAHYANRKYLKENGIDNK